MGQLVSSFVTLFVSDFFFSRFNDSSNRRMHERRVHGDAKMRLNLNEIREMGDGETGSANDPELLRKVNRNAKV